MKISEMSSPVPHTIPEVLSRYENSEKIVLICGEEELSYRELIADAKQIAHALLARGVSKGDRVVVDMSRSADYVRMYLGVLYAGGVQVTIHSGWPEQQRARVIADCAPVLMVDDAAAKALRSETVDSGAVDSLPRLEGGDPFRIRFTSGSTGAPKGVVNCHQVWANVFRPDADSEHPSELLRFFRENCRCILCDANFAFGQSCDQMILAFQSEKTVVLATEAELADAQHLAAVLRRSHVDTLFGIPSRYVRYLEQPDFAAAMKDIRLILCTGERPDPQTLNTLMDASSAFLGISYGMSEAMSLLDTPYRRGEEILYKVPLNGVQVYLIEEDGIANAPDGTVGELCIGGPVGQFGRYWNNPELTAKKYVDHPVFGRLLRTGDSAKRESDGRLRMIGRLDSMAKLRGQRIELGAIENAIQEFPGVLRAAVKLQGEGASAVLCGYYSGSVDQGALRRSLAETLPYYMVPALLRELRSLPLNLNGKLDRRALPPIETRAEAYAAPETEMETLLCEVFARVLHRDTPVGIDDSFFELGGDSIRGLAAGSLLRERGYELKVQWLFAAPSVRAVAPMLLPLEEEKETEEPLWSAELSHGEQTAIDRAVGWDRVAAVYPVLLEAGRFARNGAPFWVVEMLRVSGDLTLEELRRRLSESARCHQALRSVIVNPEKDRPLQVVLKEWEIPASCVDLHRLAEPGDHVPSERQSRYLHSLDRLLRERPFSSTQVMFEAVLVRLSERSGVLVLAYSHILLDGTGKAPIWDELTCGVPPVSDEGKYNRYIRRLASDSYRKESLRQWLPALAGRPPLNLLPLGSGADAGGGSRVYVAGSAFAKQAERFCAQRRVSISALTALALGRVLMAMNGTGEAGFLFMSNGRDAQTAQLTGMFATAFPMYVTGQDSPASVQEQIVRAGQRPVPDTAALEERVIPAGAGYPVCLSMQTYTPPEQAKTITITQLISGATVVQAAGSGSTPAPSQALTILVFPESPFTIAAVYDGICFPRSAVDGLVQRLLAELRRLVDESKEMQ